MQLLLALCKDATEAQAEIPKPEIFVELIHEGRLCSHPRNHRQHGVQLAEVARSGVRSVYSDVDLALPR